MELIVSVDNDANLTDNCGVNSSKPEYAHASVHVQQAEEAVTVDDKLLSECAEDTCSNTTTTGVHSAGIHVLTDRRLRHKYLHTGCVALAMMASGWRMSLVGPTLPDLRLIIDESLSRASWILSAIAFGGLVGSLLGGTLYDRLNKYAVFVAILLALAVASVATPWCSSFAPMVAIHVMNGACAWGIDTIFNADVVQVWRERSGPFLQAANFAYSLGAMIAPVTAEPFFAQRLAHVTTHVTAHVTARPNTSQIMLNTSYTTASDSSHAVTSSILDNVVFNASSSITMLPYSITDRGNTNLSNTLGRNLSLTHTADTHKDENRTFMEYGETNIHFAFLIVGLMSLIPCCFLLLEYCCLGSVHKYQSNTRLASTPKHHYPLSKNWRIVFVIMLATTLSTYCNNERLFYSYLMTFLTEHLHWSKGSSATATTVFWIAFTVGRLLSVFIVRRLKLVYVFVVFLVILFTGECLMLVAVRLGYSVLVWVSCGLHGLGMSALFASIVSWISVRVCPFTGTVSGLAFCIVIVGAIVYPLVVGNVMSVVSYDWFIYLEIILTTFMAFTLTFAEILYRYLTKPNTIQSTCNSDYSETSNTRSSKT